MSRHQSAEICAASIGKLLEMPKKTLRYIVSGYDTILKSDLESTDGENAYNFVHGDIDTVDTERFRWTEFTTSSY